MAEPGVLHLLISEAALETWRSQRQAGDHSVVLDRAVYLLIRDGGLSGPSSELSLRAADLDVHGLRSTAEEGGWHIVSDDEIADLLCRYTHCVSWK